MNYLLNCIVFSILTLMFTPLTHGYQCQPALTGAPCAQSGLASQHTSEPSLNLGAGNPINLVTGNKYQLQTDLPANINFPGIEIIRHYNSAAPVNDFIGYGWKLSYDTKLYKVKDSWQIIQADGSRIVFSNQDLNHQGIYENKHGQLSQINKNHYWRWLNDVSLEFDEKGYLIAIHWPNSEQLFIERHQSDSVLSGAIKHVFNVREQLLSFNYNQENLLGSIETSLGSFNYTYDNLKRLIKVTRPDGMSQHYGYDEELQSNNKYSLTSIALQQSQNDKTFITGQWQYDDKNRAISYENLDQSSKNIKIKYIKNPTGKEDGLTVVTNHLNQDTKFITAQIGGKFVLKEVTGSGCYGCSAVGNQAQYDDKARLTNINGTKIYRHNNGLPQTIKPDSNEWQSLVLNYDENGFLQNWQSKETGITSIKYNQHGLPILHNYNNTNTVEIKYDAFKRPHEIIEKNPESSINTVLEWHGNQLTKVNHPHESETLEYDDLDRVHKRQIIRSDINYTESFNYDDKNRLIEHKLPEGGSLHYHWGAQQQIKAIYWQDLDGTKHAVIDSIDQHTGYYFGNKLKLHGIANDKHRLRALNLIDVSNKESNKTIWSQYIEYDNNYRIKSEEFDLNNDIQNWYYQYDANGKLNGAANYDNNKKINNNWYAWQAGGQLLAIQEKTQNSKTSTFNNNIKHDDLGLAKQLNEFSFNYGPDRRLKQVIKDKKTIATYKHNAYGYRISNKTNQYKHSYLYLNNQLVAQANGNKIEKRYIYAHLVPIAMIQYNENNKPELFFIHADAQAAPRIITDNQQKIRWQAKYTPLGYAYDIQGDINLDLRLPGQVYDAKTNLHDNLLRTYHPQLGQYLEPDPLGPLPINQSYGYANQQPRKYADPMGLLLFAFDGTRQSMATNSNVWKMAQYYNDGEVHYHDGPGSSEFVSWDALTASQSHKIIENQWQMLLAELSNANPQETIPIDIIGFSRGAALARHFGNQVGQYVNQGLFEYQDKRYGNISACVDLRFMGLFDSVAQFGISGSQNHLYDLSINLAWDWVAHAVALHEHRWLFPLLIANDNGAYNVVEAPFIGAHSDIGGGVLPSNIGKPGSIGDLSKVALNWMVWQARAASLNFATISDDDTTINQPIIHDYRSQFIRSIQNGDRAIQSSSGKPMLNYQDHHAKFGQKTRQETEQLIQRAPNWRSRAGVEVGTVDMDGYTEWLNEELGWQSPL